MLLLTPTITSSSDPDLTYPDYYQVKTDNQKVSSIEGLYAKSSQITNRYPVYKKYLDNSPVSTVSVDVNRLWLMKSELGGVRV